MSAIELSYVDVALATTLVLVAGAISLALRLAVANRLAVAAVRTVVQLALLGLVLEWVFSQDRWYVVVALMASMVINASVAAVRRTEHRYPGIWMAGLLSVTTSSVATTLVVLGLIIRVEPIYEARYAIPLLGMVLGNTLNGLSLGLDRLMSDIDQKRVEIETWLSLGATAWEACRTMVQNAVRTGMIPIINSMTVVGIVSLPGMMTGQILGGESPENAVKYQIVVMFMIAASTAMSAMAISLLTFRRLVTTRHQLAVYRLRKL